VLQSLPRLCARLNPVLMAYALTFFAIPMLRAGWAVMENASVKRRNATRRAACLEALQNTLAGIEDGRAAMAASLRQPQVVVPETA